VTQRFVVQYADARFEVVVDLGADGEAKVVVDGVALTATPAAGPSVRITGPDGTRRVWLDDPAHPREASVGGDRIELRVSTAGQAALERARGQRAPSDGDAQVLSPMPGRVVKVLVGVGDRVDVGAPVVVVEAMKMENELQAACAGVVERVVVAAGDRVDAGALLLAIARHAAS
jgi:biotin carboxyl carrier protein